MNRAVIASKLDIRHELEKRAEADGKRHGDVTRAVAAAMVDRALAGCPQAGNLMLERLGRKSGPRCNKSTVGGRMGRVRMIKYFAIAFVVLFAIDLAVDLAEYYLGHQGSSWSWPWTLGRTLVVSLTTAAVWTGGLWVLEKRNAK